MLMSACHNDNANVLIFSRQSLTLNTKYSGGSCRSSRYLVINFIIEQGKMLTVLQERIGFIYPLVTECVSWKPIQKLMSGQVMNCHGSLDTQRHKRRLPECS